MVVVCQKIPESTPGTWVRGQTCSVNTRSAVCPAVTGRDNELAALEAAADERRLTLIAGQAGMGKSRLAAEALRGAASRGFEAMGAGLLEARDVR